MPIVDLEFTNLGPFKDVRFEFDPHVNVLVGPNNCGKSTTLLALGDIAVYPFSVPRKLMHKRPAKFRASLALKARKTDNVDGTFPVVHGENPDWPQKKMNEWLEMRKQLGFTTFVPALRLSTDYRSESPMKIVETADKRVLREARDRPDFLRRYRKEAAIQASLLGDEQIVQEIVNLDYRAYRQDKPGMREILNLIAATVSEITDGFPIEFAGIGEDKRGLYPEFETLDGKMPLGVLSQGTQSLIQWMASLFIGYAKHYDFPDTLDKSPGILIIDEIDAHLHPSWQRRILPAVTKHFPALQIFCSTHSPLMLAGQKAGQIHLLARDRKGKVTVSRNESDIIGWSSEEILTSFLGVETATDLESEQNLQRVRELRGKKRLTGKEREELERRRESANARLLAGPTSEDLVEAARKTAGLRAIAKLSASTRKKVTASVRRSTKKSGKAKG